MGMIEAALPTMPAAGVSIGTNRVAAVPQGWITDGAVQGVAINSAAAGLLFGMLMTQLAGGMSQPATGNETDAKAPKDSETPRQPSPDATSVLASLVPLFVSVAEPQPSNAPAAHAPDAVSSDGATLPSLALATLTAVAATTPSVQPALSMPDSAPVESQPGTPPAAGTPDAVSSGATILTPPTVATVGALTATRSAAHSDLPMDFRGPGEILAATPAENQVPVAVDTHAQGQMVQTILTTIPATGEPKNPSGTATASDAGADLGQALPSPVASIDKKSDQLPSVQSSIGIDATLTKKRDEPRDDVRVVDLTPTGSEKIRAEFLAGPAPSPSTSTDPAALPKAAVVADDAPAAITPRETIHLQLSPSDLGRLTLHVSVQSQQVQATVSVEHRGLGEFLTASQGALDGALRQHGLRLEELHIDTMGNPDVLGAGAGRTGLLDHGQPRQDSPGFDRELLTRPRPESEVSSTRADVLEPLGSRHRINLFA